MKKDISPYIRKYEKALEVLEPAYVRGRDNARYYRGENWTEKDRKAHESQGFFHAYSIPLLAVKMNRILAAQRVNRTDAKARGRGMEDELGAETVNYIFKYIDDMNQFKWIESEIYQDGLCKLYGVLNVDVDKSENPYGDIIYKKIPFDQFFYDTNSIEYNLEDATFMGEFKWIPMHTAKVLFKDFEFEKYGDINYNPGVTSVIFDRIKSLFSDNSSIDGYKITDWLDEKKKLVKLCQIYDLEYKTRYLVKNLKSGDFLPFASQDDADNFILMQISEEIQKIGQAENGYNKIFKDEDFVVIPKKLPCWKKILFTGNVLIEESEHKYSKPPYFRYSALFDEGTMWTLTDLAKDSQKGYDRYMSMVDKATAKNIKGNNYEILLDRLHPSETKDGDALAARLSSGGQLIKALMPGVINPINKFSDIRVEASVASSYQANIEDLLGGNTYQGIDNTTRQTATEVQLLERNASQTGMLYADNLARWKQNVYKYTLELIKDIYTPDRTLRVIGEVGSKKIMETFQSTGIYSPSELYPGGVGYLDLRNLPKPLADTEIDIVIDNVQNTKLDKDEKFNQVMALNQIAITAYGRPLPLELLVQYSNLDPTLKHELQVFQEQAEAEREAQMRMQEDMGKAKALTDIVKTVKPQSNGAQVNQE